MTTPANLTYTQIETRVMNQLRIPVTNVTEQAKVSGVINEVYRDIYMKQDWHWLRKRTVINTVAKYTTGTANVANLSTAVTLSSAPAAGLGSFAGYVFFVIGDTTDNNAVYRISSHTAGSAALTLDAAFTGTTSAAIAYRIYQDEYSLPLDFGKLLKPRRYGRDFPLAIVSASEIADLKTSDQSEGKPAVCAVSDFATTGDPTTARRLLVHPYPDKTYRLELSYKQQLNTELGGTTQPLIPDEYRHILIYGALARGYPIFLADTERGTFFQGLFNDTLNLMTAIHREYNQEKPQFAPLDADRRRFPQRKRGRVSLGSYFDTHPSEDSW